VQDYFSPISVEDVAERIKKIRKKAAAGPDGLSKEHLMVPDLPVTLTKIYNICLYISYYPSVWKNNRTTLILKPKKSALNTSKNENGVIFTIVDISKAFDTISHSALTPCLARKGVPAPIIKLISNMYVDNTTKIRANNKEGMEIKILRGVRQGDPYRPCFLIYVSSRCWRRSNE
jgi:hypothetical protein